MRFVSLVTRRLACAVLALAAVAPAFGRPAAGASPDVPANAAPAAPAAPWLLIEGPADASGRRKATLLTLADLEALPQQAFTTASPWTRQPQHYAGPLLRDVLRRAGAVGTTIRATALDEYQVQIPAEDAQLPVIVALRIDGKLIPVRDRGPMAVIYPFDQRPDLREARYYKRSIWQLKTLRVD